MIVASHQPNFLPYMGYFYKMYMCDVFTFSDTVLFSRQGFHNYNFVRNGESDQKITVPVNSRSSIIREVELSDWEYNRNKIWKRLSNDYAHAPYFKALSPLIKDIFDKDYNYLYELNLQLINVVYKLFKFDCKLLLESELNIKGHTATEQIADICNKTDCYTYLSGIGAKVYLDEPYLNKKGIEVKWSEYKPENNLSVFDYLMNKGDIIPDQWKKGKEVLLNGRI